MRKLLFIIAVVIASASMMLSCTKTAICGNTPSLSVAVSATDKPSAPNSISILCYGASDSLYWNANNVEDGVTAYRIYAGASPDALTQIGTTADLYFKQTGLINGTTYYYTVVAINRIGESIQSSVVNTTAKY